MKKIYLIRHAKTAGNLEKRYIGTTDQPLAPSGISELNLRKELYPEAGMVLVSPLKRCVETAEILYPQVPRIVIDGLAECCFGIFEYKNYRQLKNNLHYKTWVESGGLSDIPQGENGADFRERCRNAFADTLDLIYDKGVECAAIIAHGGTFMAILERYAPEKKEFYDWRIENCGMFELTVDNKIIKNVKKI